jgi:hypothetical protein
MPNKLDRIMNLILKNQKLSNTFQKRVLEYGIKEKNYQLLADLAKREDIDLDILNRLDQINSYIVKIALLGRNNLTEEYIINSLNKETRVKVLSSLAESDQLSDNVYKAIAKISDNKKVLSNILLNKKVTEDVRNLASQKLIKRFKNRNDIDVDFLNELRFIYDNNKNIIKFLESDSSLTVALFLSQKIELTEEKQYNFVSKYINYLTPDISKTTYSYYDNPVEKFIDLVNGLINNGAIYHSVYNLLDPIFEIVKKNCSGYQLQKVNDIQSEAFRAQPNGIEQYNSLIKSLEDPSNLDNIINEVETQRVTKNLPFPEKKLTLLANHLIKLDYVTDSALKFIDDISGYRGSFVDKLNKCKSANDYKRLARIYAYIRSINLSDVLNLVDDKDLLFKEILMLSESIQSTKFHELIGSEHFKEEYLNHFPIKVISKIHENDQFISSITNILSEIFENQSYYENLEILLEDFDGSLGGLVNTAKII